MTSFGHEFVFYRFYQIVWEKSGKITNNFKFIISITDYTICKIIKK